MSRDRRTYGRLKESKSNGWDRPARQISESKSQQKQQEQENEQRNPPQQQIHNLHNQANCIHFEDVDARPEKPDASLPYSPQ